MSLGNGDSQLDIDNILERLLKGLFMILLFYTIFIFLKRADVPHQTSLFRFLKRK